MRPFFDNNVLVYAFDEGAPEKREVAHGLIKAHLDEGDGMLSLQVLREFYAAARRPSRPVPDEEAEEAVRYFATFAPIAEDTRMVLGAVRRSRDGLALRRSPRRDPDRQARALARFSVPAVNSTLRRTARR